MLWVDKYRPSKLEDVDVHGELTPTLEKVGTSADMPHLLFYGPSGAGKKTRAMAVLEKQFGPSVMQLKLEHKTMQVSDSKSVDIATLSSPHHIDINPSDAGSYDRVVVMQMIREIAATAPMVTSGSGTGPKFKVVVLNEVDKMTRAAQQALRRTMEKYMSTCRLVLLCSSTARLIPPLRSRCLGIRVPACTKDEISTCATRICQKEGLPVPSSSFLSVLSHRSDGNLRRAVLTLEASKMTKADFTGNGGDIPQAEWRLYVQEIANDVVSEQTPRRLNDVRQKFYELLGQCIPSDVILRDLTHALLTFVDAPLRPVIVCLAAEYDHNMKLGSKPIMHLEAFAAQVMKAVKQHNSRQM